MNELKTTEHAVCDKIIPKAINNLCLHILGDSCREPEAARWRDLCSSIGCLISILAGLLSMAERSPLGCGAVVGPLPPLL